MSFTSRIAAAAARGYGMFRLAAGAVVDPFFNYVTALLHGDGTNGAQNNTFLDSSTNNFTITRNGNTTQGTFSPFAQTGWSNYFGGAGNYLSNSSTALIGATTTTFTAEAWIFMTAAPTTDANNLGSVITLDGQAAAALNYNCFGPQSSQKLVFRWFDGASKSCTGSTTIPLNTWTHIALVVNANAIAMYVNGAAETLTGTTTLTNRNSTAGAFAIAAHNYSSFSGYISNLRVTTTAVYTAAFTPSTTPLTAITGTVLLTSQSNRFVDNSSNAYALTVGGTPSVQAFSPFNPTSAWSASSNGGSGYFDGSGDYLIVANNTALQMGSGDFTIEFWINYSSITGYQTPFDKGYTNAGGLLFQTGNGNGRLVIYASGSAVITETGTAPTNAWIHYALVRSGTTLTLYRDGVSSGTATNSTNFNNINQVGIGATGTAPPAGAVGDYPIRGYLADLRVVKGTAVYTANFTPPTAPLTAITNTSLLLNYTNAGIYDNAAVGDYETVGNAQVSTAVVKYGTGSMAFDGTGDWLSSPNQQGFNLGSGDFTIECWVYLNNLTNPYAVFGKRVDTGTETKWVNAYINTTGTIQTQLSTSGAAWLFNTATTTKITSGTWNHIAWVRLGSNFYVYVNGLQNTMTTTLSGSVYTDSSALILGATGTTGSFIYSMNGYIDDFRITKGIARYPYNFTPPAAAFPNIGGTVTLTADPYYNYTTLLLPGNGTNGAQNNTFLDSSSNAFTITRNGNTTQGTFSPFSQTGWSNYFNGSSYITTPNVVALPGNFTIETWVYYPGSVNSGLYVGAINVSGYGYWCFYYNTSVSAFRVVGTASATFIQSPAVTLQPNQWIHVAVTRSGTTVNWWVNGTSIGTTTDSTNWTGSAATTFIGSIDGTNQNFTGYLSNLRVVVGTAVYTSNFTPSIAPLTAVSGTWLLTAQSNRFVDNSSNAYALTSTGTSVQAFSPFAPTAAYSASTVGGSGYFDGSGDYLSIASNAALDGFTGDFTIEFWYYPITLAGTILNKGWDTASTFSPYLFLNSGGNVLFYASSNNSSWDIASGVTIVSGIKTNTWTHVAVSRSGSSLRLFANGALTTTITSSATFLSSVYALTVGSANAGASVMGAGYLTDVRIVKGTAVYTAAFTPPTAPLTAITNTSLLLSATNGAIVDATAKNDLETVGNAQISTTQSKFGGSSMYFDGTGDGLRQTVAPLWSFGTADFTIEAWVYPTAFAAGSSVIACQNQTNASAGLAIALALNASGQPLVLAAASTGAYAVNFTGTALSLNTWTHVAVTRYGNTFTIWQNGVSTATASSSVSITQDSTAGGYGGWNIGYSPITGQTLTGYIDDFRFTKGIARYTSNFTPPTSAFLLQ